MPSYQTISQNGSDRPPPRELGASLTFLEGEIHHLVLAAEYIACATGHLNNSPNLQRAITFNKTITTWAKLSILESDEVEGRAEIMSSFVKTAKVTPDLGVVCVVADSKACFVLGMS
jgi:hypothetical protein